MGRKAGVQVASPATEPVAVPDSPAVSTTTAAEISAGGSGGDVQWAYDNYANEKATAETAPTPGAWGLLDACRHNYNTYMKVLERVHPREAGLTGAESADALLDIEQRLRNDWKQLVVVLNLASTRPEFSPDLLAFTQKWREDHPAEFKMNPADADLKARHAGREPGDLPV